MPTQKPNLKSVEEFMAGYKPIYNPLFGLFLGKSKQHAAEVGKVDYRRVKTVGDIRSKNITPKDTEQHLISVGEAKKTYKKYFKGCKYELSALQANEGTDQVISEVLDELNKQYDEMFLLGEGTSAGTVINNGLYWSADANYQLESSDEIALSNQLWNLHANIMAQKAVADQVAGRKLFISYGDVSLKINSLFPGLSAILKSALVESLGSNYSLVEMPAAITPSSVHGYIIANMDQIDFHRMSLPAVNASGFNSEDNYYWWNFLTSSCMLEVLAPKAIIRQPLTFAVA